MRVCAALILALLFVSSSYGGEAQTVRIGLAGKGWTTGSQAVKEGATYSGLTAFEGTKDSGDLLMECGAEGILAYTCSRERCRVVACSTSSEGVIVHTITQPKTPSKSARPLSGMLTSLLRREPKPVGPVGVRAIGGPNDAVLLKSGESVHWGPALKGVGEGEYCLRLGSVSKNSAEASSTVNVSWDRGSDPEGAAQASKVAAGLHLLEKGVKDEAGHCEISPEATPAWVLVVDESEFSEVAKAWTDYGSQLKQLNGSGGSPELQTTVRHAALAYLSDDK